MSAAAMKGSAFAPASMLTALAAAAKQGGGLQIPGTIGGSYHPGSSIPGVVKGSYQLPGGSAPQAPPAAPPGPPYAGYLTQDEMMALAAQQAQFQILPQQQLYQQQQASADQSAASQQASATAAYAALAQLLQGIGPAVQSGYTNAADHDAMFAKGFSDGLAHIQGQTQSEAGQALALSGGSAGQTPDAGLGGTGATNALYETGGYLPASALNREGAAFGAAASMLPNQALGTGQQTVAGLRAQQGVTDQNFAAQIAGLAAQIPGLQQTALQNLQSYQTQLAGQAENKRQFDAQQGLATANAKENKREFGVSTATQQKQFGITARQHTIDSAEATRQFNAQAVESKREFNKNWLATVKQNAATNAYNKTTIAIKKAEDKAAAAGDTRAAALNQEKVNIDAAYKQAATDLNFLKQGLDPKSGLPLPADQVGPTVQKIIADRDAAIARARKTVADITGVDPVTGLPSEGKRHDAVVEGQGAAKIALTGARIKLDANKLIPMGSDKSGRYLVNPYTAEKYAITPPVAGTATGGLSASGLSSLTKATTALVKQGATGSPVKQHYAPTDPNAVDGYIPVPGSGKNPTPYFQMLSQAIANGPPTVAWAKTATRIVNANPAYAFGQNGRPYPMGATAVQVATQFMQQAAKAGDGRVHAEQHARATGVLPPKAILSAAAKVFGVRVKSKGPLGITAQLPPTA